MKLRERNSWFEALTIKSKLNNYQAFSFKCNQKKSLETLKQKQKKN